MVKSRASLAYGICLPFSSPDFKEQGEDSDEGSDADAGGDDDDQSKDVVDDDEEDEDEASKE